MLNFMVHSVWKPPTSGLLSPFCITGRKSPGNPPRTKDPTTRTNCQTPKPATCSGLLTVSRQCKKRAFRTPTLLRCISNPWLWAPIVWGPRFPMEGRQAPWGKSLLCSPFCLHKGWRHLSVWSKLCLRKFYSALVGRKKQDFGSDCCCQSITG